MSALRARWRALLPGATDEPATDAEGVVVARRRIQGLAFYRSGRVVGLRVEPGRLSGGVQGARATPFHVEALMPTLDEQSWATIVETVAGEVRFAAALLAGRFPDELVEALADRGVDLFGDPEDFDARCPCGEAARPCAHLVALWEAATECFLDDPFAMFHLRGRGRQRMLADLSATRRAAGSDDEAWVPLASLSADGWERAKIPLEDLEVGLLPRPETVAASLRLLGDPPGWKGAQSSYETLGPLVAAGAREAKQRADSE